MRARYHVVASAVVAVGFQSAVNSWPAALGCFLSGVLIDLDHYLEYCILRGKFPFRYKELVEFCLYGKDNKVYLLFHAYEFIVILWAGIYFFHLGSIWIGIALGLTVHMIFDQFTNPIRPLFYFLTFRFAQKFEKSKLLTEAYLLKVASHDMG